MASSASEVPYNHATENVLFGQNVVEKISDTCLGQDGKRYYQVKWRDSWEPEERLMAACEGALQTFWKDYYSNVEQEIRKQVVNAAAKVTTPVPVKPIQITTTPTSSASLSTVVDSFPEQSSTVAYYAVQDNADEPLPVEGETKQIENEIVEVGEQAEILSQIINSVAATSASGSANKWDEERPTSGRKSLTTITADTLNTKSVSGPDQNARFHCDICMRTFVSKRNVQRHMLSHTGEKPWMCEFCFKRFRQKPHLEHHVNIHKGVKNAVCNICGKAFNHRSNLVTHMATHSNVRPYSCEICGESFKLKHTLQKHALVHSKDPENRHQCKICKRSFRDKSYLAEHETIHKKEKPYQCDICLKSFSFKRRYQIHMEIHQNKDTGEAEFVCHLCPKKFKGKVHLQKHLEKHESKKIRRRKKKRKALEGTGALQELHANLDAQLEDHDSVLKQEDATSDFQIALADGTVVNENKMDEVQILGQEQEISVQLTGADGDNISMLPLTSLNMDDATYVALAQLTQAAMESSQTDTSGNVILMSYEDIQRSMQEFQQNQEQETVEYASLQDIQIAQQHLSQADQASLDAILKAAQQQQQIDLEDGTSVLTNPE